MLILIYKENVLVREKYLLFFMCLNVFYWFKFFVCVRIEGKDLVYVIVYVYVYFYKRLVFYVGC